MEVGGVFVGLEALMDRRGSELGISARTMVIALAEIEKVLRKASTG